LGAEAEVAELTESIRLIILIACEIYLKWGVKAAIGNRNPQKRVQTDLPPKCFKLTYLPKRKDELTPGEMVREDRGG
jgi:hypothetical protein